MWIYKNIKRKVNKCLSNDQKNTHTHEQQMFVRRKKNQKDDNWNCISWSRNVLFENFDNIIIDIWLFVF